MEVEQNENPVFGLVITEPNSDLPGEYHKFELFSIVEVLKTNNVGMAYCYDGDGLYQHVRFRKVKKFPHIMGHSHLCYQQELIILK